MEQGQACGQGVRSPVRSHPLLMGKFSLPSFCKDSGRESHGQGVHPGTIKCEPPAHLHRYEDYVDEHYKEFLKNQGKVDSVRRAELAGGRRHGEAPRSSPSCPLSPHVTVFALDP